MAKRSKRSFNIKALLCITLIVFMNLLGISYSYYNDSVDINVSISTGEWNPRFILANKDNNMRKMLRCGNLLRNQMNNSFDEEINVQLSNDGQTLLINGSCYSDYEDDISILLNNNGSVPIILESDKLTQEDNIIESITFNNNIIQPNKGEELILHINANNVTKFGKQSFKYKMRVKQYIGD